MKKIVVMMLFVASLFAKDVDIKPFQNLSMFSNPNVKVLRVYDHGALYQVKFSSQTPQGKRIFTAFITKDKKAFIMGEAFDIKSRKALKFPLNVAQIKKNADLVYGKGKQELIVITDPECNYCQIFESKWEGLKDRYTFYVYLYPLSHHKEAMKMSYFVMKQKNNKAKYKALDGIVKGEKNYIVSKLSQKELEALNKKLQGNFALAQELGVQGTPSVYDFEGNFVNWSRLLH